MWDSSVTEQSRWNLMPIRDTFPMFIRKEEFDSKLCRFLKNLLLLIDPVISDNQSVNLVETNKFIQPS